MNAWLTLGDDHIQVDCLWPDARLIGELDDFHSHGSKRVFRKDRKRDRRLGAAGYRVVRITSGQIGDEPAALAADLLAILGYP